MLQVQRLMDENERLRVEISANREREQSLANELADLKNKVVDIDSKVTTSSIVCWVGTGNWELSTHGPCMSERVQFPII